MYDRKIIMFSTQQLASAVRADARASRSFRRGSLIPKAALALVSAGAAVAILAFIAG